MSDPLYDSDDSPLALSQAEFEAALAEVRDDAFRKGRAAQRADTVRLARAFSALNGDGEKFLAAVEALSEPVRKRFDETKVKRDHGKFSSTGGSDGNVGLVGDRSGDSDSPLDTGEHHRGPEESVDPDAKARTLAARFSEVPAAFARRVGAWVEAKYAKLSARYGPTGAKAVLGAMILLSPTPVPGSSLIPIALAEVVKRLRGAIAGTLEKASAPELSDEEAQAVARYLLHELNEEMGEEFESVAPVTKAFDPNEKRDESGKWSESGGAKAKKVKASEVAAAKRAWEQAATRSAHPDKDGAVIRAREKYTDLKKRMEGHPAPGQESESVPVPSSGEYEAAHSALSESLGYSAADPHSPAYVLESIENRGRTGELPHEFGRIAYALASANETGRLTGEASALFKQMNPEQVQHVVATLVAHDVDGNQSDVALFLNKNVGALRGEHPSVQKAIADPDPPATPDDAPADDDDSADDPDPDDAEFGTVGKAWDESKVKRDHGKFARNAVRAEVLMRHADENLAIGPKHVERANDETGGPLKGISRAARLRDLVEPSSVTSFRIRATDAGIDAHEREHLERAIANMESHQRAAHAALAKHVAKYAATLPDAPPVSDPKAARKTVPIDLAEYPEELRSAVAALVEKTGHVGALGLGTLRLVAEPKGELARVWDATLPGAFDTSGSLSGRTADQLEDLWEKSKAPVQFAVADVPERAKGRTTTDDEGAPNPSDVVRYKRLSRDILLRYDPTESDYALIARADAPETIGVPDWAQSDIGEPPERSGYTKALSGPLAPDDATPLGPDPAHALLAALVDAVSEAVESGADPEAAAESFRAYIDNPELLAEVAGETEQKAVRVPKGAEAVADALREFDAEELDGLRVEYHPDGPKFWIDQMDWHDGKAGKIVIAAAEKSAGMKAQEGYKHKDGLPNGRGVYVFNEGPNPPGDGWVDLLRAARPELYKALAPVEKPTAAVDLDATLAQYDGWKGADHFGAPLTGAREFLAELSQTHRVLIFTTRTKADDPALGRDGQTAEQLAALVRGWLQGAALPFDEVYTGQGKPIADVYVDDRAVSLPPNPTPADYTVALAAIRARSLLKAWDSSLHPRADHGRFVSKEAIHAARSDPAKADELRERVTAPAERAKLDAALSGKTDTGRTQRGRAKERAAPRRADKAATKARADDLIRKISAGKLLPETHPLTADDLHALADHLPTMTVADLRRARVDALRTGVLAKMPEVFDRPLELDADGVSHADILLPSASAAGGVNKAFELTDYGRVLVQKAFNEAKVHRGQPGNAGQFGPGGPAARPMEKPVASEAPASETPKPPHDPGVKSASPRKPRTQPDPPPPRFERNDLGRVVVNADVQRWCEGTNEPAVAKVVGGTALPDNEPMDVVLPPPPDSPAHGLELKTMVANEHRQIRMKASAQKRKRSWRRENGVPVHTVVIDDTEVYNAKGPGQHDLSKRRVFYRRGFGSFKVDRMHEVEGGFEGLSELIATPTRKLPPGAWKPKPKSAPVQKSHGQPPWPGAVLQGDPPRWHNPHTNEPVGHDEHADTAARLIHTSDISPEQKREYHAHMTAVLAKMPAGSRAAALSALAHDHGGAKVVFHPDLDSLEKALRGAGVKIARNEEVGGCVIWRPRVFDRVQLHLDGAGAGNTAQGVYAHELGHLIALSNGQKPAKTFADIQSELSADPTWVKAWKAEIKNGTGEKKLSTYARTDEHEGFAELYRHLHERGADDARKRWPRCVKFLESKGLL